MPPAVSVSRERMVEAAFELVRREGLDALTARRVAQELGSSTQPIYTSYSNIEALRQEVKKRAKAVADGYLMPKDATLPFFEVGLGALRFARDEPQLFRLSMDFLRDQVGKPPPASILERMKAEPLLAALTDEQLTRIHTLMWLFSMGASTLVVDSTRPDAMETAATYLMQAGQAVVEQELRRQS